MRKAKIRIVAALEIKQNSTDQIHVDIFNSTYQEFQVQMGRGQISTFSTLKSYSPPNAIAVERQIAIAGAYYLNQIERFFNNVHPRLGDFKIPATNIEIKLIESDVQDPSKHLIKLLFISDELILIDSYGENLLLTFSEAVETLNTDGSVKTFELNNSNGDFEIRSYTPII